MTAHGTRFHLLTVLLLATACWDDYPLPDIPDPTIPWPNGDDDDGEEEGDEDDACSSEGEEEMCEGVVGGYTADDPCCAVHQCLAGSGSQACDNFDTCMGLADAGVVCGDTLCDGMECSYCPDQYCAPANACLAACDDPCDLDCQINCWQTTSPDCVGTACVEMACEECF